MLNFIQNEQKIGSTNVAVRCMLLLIVIAFMFALTGCEKNKVSDVQSTGYASASWADHYTNAEEMINDSVLIIRGKKINESTILQNDLVFTEETIEVNKVYKGNLEKKTTITVLQTGGELDGETTAPIEDTKFMDNGGEYILFLEISPSGKYYLIKGGFQGIGKINKESLVFNKIDDEIAKEYEKKVINEIENEIETIVGK